MNTETKNRDIGDQMAQIQNTKRLTLLASFLEILMTLPKKNDVNSTRQKTDHSIKLSIDRFTHFGSTIQEMNQRFRD